MANPPRNLEPSNSGINESLDGMAAILREASKTKSPEKLLGANHKAYDIAEQAIKSQARMESNAQLGSENEGLLQCSSSKGGDESIDNSEDVENCNVDSGDAPLPSTPRHTRNIPNHKPAESHQNNLEGGDEDSDTFMGVENDVDSIDPLSPQRIRQH
ncbi:hypothetical protein BCR34DRAFT_606006 [Clohesyomyces aquaticus]|uniref:Uncharacterized protein n=1 Tax=Clohesyomyces aquaticus TaxID=1231657 RepID=A0A1Y1YTK2_9PLEO|nr:hypothetical protein BCR34DRAFT_606006 [Clohesyomyces aquaticus]